MRRIYKKFLTIICTILIAANVSFADPKKDIKEFQDRLNSIASSVKANLSVKIVSADKLELIYDYNPGAKMIPASITKVITASTAYHFLGTGYQFKTIIYTDDSNINDGVINGNLYLKGYGDPDLNSSDIMSLARDIASKNIKSVTGNIIYDDTYLDDNHFGLANYYSGDTGPSYWPYVGAINLDKNPGKRDPAPVAANLLLSELNADLVTVSGIVVAGVTPGASKEVAEVSHSIDDILYNMAKSSDNHSAITVFKVAGAKFAGAPGSLEKGQNAVIDFLTSLGIDRYSYEILEGSGLTRYNYINSDVYIKLFKYMYDNEEMFNHFYKILPIAGRDGTLRNRMIGTEAEGNVHAKTGTLNLVSALTGYAVTRDSELFIFFTVMNGGNNNHCHIKQDEFCQAICGFSRYQ
jgi:D-alanyl-D-alanine carboxypeptidase/D-alanyl-D-alanine-endopeptidase (penicillin-binding protein 4)